jgi:lipid A 3-O-deacylase
MFLPLASVGTVIVGAAAFVGGAFVAPRADPGERNHLIASVGDYDVLRNRASAAEFRLGYRWQPTGWRLRPWVGAMATSKRSSWFGAGIAYDFPLGQRVVLTPSFAPGLYSRGDGFDLGHVVEFRSQLEAAYRVSKRSRIGISLSHMSNAKLGALNPGEESLMLNCTVAP